MSDRFPVVLLTTGAPKPVNCYLIGHLLALNLLDAVVLVQRPKWRWKLRQFRRILARQGWRGVMARRTASRMRQRLLRPVERRALDRSLFPAGPPRRLALPNSVPTFQAGRLDEAQTVELLRSLRPRLGVQAGAGWIRKPLLDVPDLGFLSLHHGMLPAIRGMDSIPWAYVENRGDWCGITLQLLDEGLDTGRVIGHVATPPLPGENPYAVMARATCEGTRLMSEAIPSLLAEGVPSTARPAGRSGAYRSALTSAAILRLDEMIRLGITPGGPAAGAL